jgi:hypothetical protein
MSSRSRRSALAAIFAVTTVAVLLAAIWLPQWQQQGGSHAGVVQLQVPTAATEAQFSGKEGEVGPPTPFPTVILPEMTPVPPGGDASFDATPTPGYYVPPTRQAGDPFILQVSVGMIAHTADQVTNEAQAVVVGVVKQVGPPRWTTPDGSRPANPHLQTNRDYIITPVIIQVTNAPKTGKATGLGPGAELVLQAFGGQIGEDKVEWLHDQDNLYQVGQRVVVFLAAPTGQDRLQTIGGRPAWVTLDRYTVDANNRARNWHSDMPVEQLLDIVGNAAQGPPKTKP